MTRSDPTQPPVPASVCSDLRAACADRAAARSRFAFRAALVLVPAAVAGAIAYAAAARDQDAKLATRAAVLEQRVVALEAVAADTLPRIDSRLADLSVAVATLAASKEETPQ